MKIFDLVVAMSGSGPGFVTDVPGIYVYDLMGKAGRYDKGTAAALVLLVTACMFVVPYLIRIYRRKGGPTSTVAETTLETGCPTSPAAPRPAS